MYACFSNIGNWDERSLGFLGVVKGEQCIVKGYAAAMQEFVIGQFNNPENTNTRIYQPINEKELHVQDMESNHDYYNDVMEENEMSWYFNGEPMFFVVVSGGDYIDAVFAFVKL